MRPTPKNLIREMIGEGRKQMRPLTQQDSSVVKSRRKEQ
jgi:hypothetical protein